MPASNHSATTDNRHIANRRFAIQILVPVVIFIVSAVIYGPAMDSPFAFDSRTHIEDNERVKLLYPPNWFYGRRWLPNLTFALDYKIHGENIWGFHLTNVAIHAFAGSLLFCLVQSAIHLRSDLKILYENQLLFAAATSLIWAAHPIQTQSVIYTVQRMESMMGLFFFLALLAFSYSFQSTHRLSWMFVSVLACFMSAFCKEVAISIPIVIYLFDFCFCLSGKDQSNGSLCWTSFKEIFVPIKRRWLYYLVLGSVVLVFGDVFTEYFASTTTAGVTDSTSGAGYQSAMNVKGLSAISYAVNQPSVVIYYVTRVFFPFNLCLDHAWPISSLTDQWISVSAVALAFVIGGWWLVRKRPAGFCIVSFFIVLAPTSSFLPIQDLCYEHRMYVPLAMIVSLFTGFVVAAMNRYCPPNKFQLAIFVVLVGTLAVSSLVRCQTYRTRVTLWEDVLRKAPHNPRAYMNHAEAIYHENEDFESAIRDYQKCIERLKNPDKKIPEIVNIENVYVDLSKVHNNFASRLLRKSKFDEAKFHIEKSIAYGKENAYAYVTYGNYFFKLRDKKNAKQWYLKALEINPQLEAARKNLDRLNGSR